MALEPLDTSDKPFDPPPLTGQRKVAADLVHQVHAKFNKYPRFGITMTRDQYIQLMKQSLATGKLDPELEPLPNNPWVIHD